MKLYSVKKCCAILFFLYRVSLLYAADTGAAKIDSLLNKLPQATDSLKVHILSDICWELKYTDPERAVDYGNKALTLAKQLNYQSGVARAYNNLGFVLLIKTNYPEALDDFLESIKIEKNNGDKINLAYSLTNLGAAYREINDFEQAIIYYQKSMAVTITFNFKKPEIYALKGLGLAYLGQGDYDRAKVYFSQMYDLAWEKNYKELAGTALRHIGEMNMLEENYDSAVNNFSKSLDLLNKVNAKTSAAIVLCDLGGVYYKQGNYQQALEYYLKTLSIREGVGTQYGIVIVTNLLAKTYQQLGQWSAARQFADRSLSLARKLGVKKGIRDVLETQMGIYFQLKDYQQAFGFQRLFMALKDSIFNEEKSMQISRMQARFDMDQKETRISEQQQKISLLEKNKNMESKFRIALIICAVLGFLLAAFVYRRYVNKQRTANLLLQKSLEIETKNAEIESMNKELEIRMLRAQMDPHFIFNSLSAIQHFIVNNDKESALKYLTRFSKLVRQVLENSINQKVLLADDIKILEYYIELENLRFGGAFEYNIKVDDNLDIYNIEVPFLLLQPYVENAIVHGLRPKRSGMLTILLKNREEYLICTIEDNGIGRVAARKLQVNGNAFHTSRGMSVTERRIQALNRGQNLKTCVQVTDLYDDRHHAAGTRVEIKIPLELD